MEFAIYKVGTMENTIVWTGRPEDTTAPIAFQEDMRYFGSQMAVGDRLNLNSWHYALKLRN